MSPRPEIPYEEIAAIVRDWPTITGYGRHIAEKYGVPMSTARRWIYKARKLGLLPPGSAERTCRTCGGTGFRKWRT